MKNGIGVPKISSVATWVSIVLLLAVPLRQLTLLGYRLESGIDACTHRGTPVSAVPEYTLFHLYMLDTPECRVAF